MPKIIKPKVIAVSEEALSKFTKIDLDNVKDFFNSDTLFLSVNTLGKKKKSYTLHSQFQTRCKFVRGANLRHCFFNNNKVMVQDMPININESQEDYDWAMDDMKAIVKDLIKRNMLYGRKF
jgi:hypothetical protein